MLIPKVIDAHIHIQPFHMMKPDVQATFWQKKANRAELESFAATMKRKEHWEVAAQAYERAIRADTTRLIWLLSMPAARARWPSEDGSSAAPSSAMVRHSHRLTPNSRR